MEVAEDMESTMNGHSKDQQDSYPCKKCSFKGKTLSTLRSHITRMHMDREMKQFGCTFLGCDHRATDKSALSQHIRRRHTANKEQLKVHACNQCDFKAIVKSELRSHVISHTSEKPFLCDFPSCSFQTKTQRGLNNHKKRHDPDQDRLKVHSCKFCDYRCRFKTRLVIHMRTHTGDMPFACEFPGCSYRSRQLGHLQTHRRKHDPDLMFKCDFPGCEFRTAVRTTLRYHLETHNSERKKDIQCPMCPKIFFSEMLLKIHIKGVHTKEQRFSCKLCDSTFGSMAYLRCHISKAHATEVKGVETILRKFKCSVCDYCSVYKEAVLRHQKWSHSDVKNFACPYCEYRAKSQHYVRVHQYNCPGLPRVRSFECKICKKGFFNRKHLRDHRQYVHSTDKRLKCQMCDFATNYDRVFNSHLETHAGEGPEVLLINRQIRSAGLRRIPNGRSRENKNHENATAGGNAEQFKCEFLGCKYFSSQRASLRAHELRHRPEMQNIPCPMCPKKFFDRGALKSHICAVHAKEKPFKCDLCEYSSIHAVNIRKHKLRKHRNKVAVMEVKRGKPNIIVPAQQLGVSVIYSCPFCTLTHAEYMAIVRHTVTHRLVAVCLERQTII